LNNLLYHLGFGIAGRLKTKKEKYNGKKKVFNYTKVFIRIWENKNRFSYEVMCNCNDPFAQGLGNSTLITIFSKNAFKSQVETESSIDRQVRFAQKKFKQTEFYLEKKILVFDSGKPLDALANFIYKNGKWKITNPINSEPICRSCGNIITKNIDICNYCGEPVIG
jgi:hypothetical protein